MTHLPTPILGNITAITITTPDLEQSLAYYQKLGFSMVMRNDWPFPWVQVSDGVLLIMLRKDPKPYIALTYYVQKIEEVVKDLESKGIAFDQKAKKSDMVKRYLLHSPDGLNISLVSMVDGFTRPPGQGMLQMPQADYFTPDKYVNKTIGMYGEFAHPVSDLDASIAFWEKLGFKAISKFSSPYPWAIMSDGLAVVGLHQSQHFGYPAITYFAADMGSKITALKKKGLKDYKEDSPGNIRLTTPEQQHIFLFSMGGGEESSGQKEIQLHVIETDRLLLKLVTPAILDELYATRNDEEIMAFMGLQTAEELATERHKWEGGFTTYRMTVLQFMLEDKASGKVIGRASLHNWYPEHKRAELGYLLSDETMRNKGYTKEAAAAIVKYGFEQMGLNRIEAYVNPGNAPSLKIVKGLGFTQEGLLREHFCKNGTPEDSACFALLKKEYRGQLQTS